MPKPDHEASLLPSLLDRVLDDRPDLSSELAASRAQNLRTLRRSLARDIEALLNTRREALDPVPEEFVELQRSLLNYGLPDFTSFNLTGTEDRARIRRYLEDALATFEPRLERLRVTLEPPREHDRTLRFRVDALLRVDPAPEPVMFDMVLRLNTQEYVVHRQD